MAKVARFRSHCQAATQTPGRRLAMLGVVALAMCATMVEPPSAALDSPDAHAIRDARIYIAAGRIIDKGTIVLRNGLIVDVGPNVRIPADARVIDGTGLTVYPGLIDGYTNLGLAAPQTQAPAAGRAAAAAAAPTQQQPEERLGDPSASAADQVRPGGTAIEDAKTAGVTTALTSPRQGIFAGQSAIINLAGDDAAKMVVRSPVALTIQFTTGGFGGTYPGSLMGTVAYIRQTFYDAINYRDKVERYNRVKRGIERPQHDKKLAALQPALRGELPVLFVANSPGDIRRALMISDEFKLKPMIAGALFGYRVVDLLKAKNVPVILSVDYPRRAADLPDDEDEPLRALRERAEAPTGPAALAKAGVKFAFTSGSLRPQDFIANVQKAVENGLSKDDAIRALTANAAEILGAAEQLGTIEAGKIANLVVTSGDLLSRDGKVRHVFIDGKEIELKKPETPRPGAGPPGRTGPPAGGIDPAGAWSLTVRTPQGDMNLTLTLRRSGEGFSATMSSPMGTTEVPSVSVIGNQVRFTANIEMGGNNVEITMSGTIEGNSIQGTFSLAGLGTVEFSGSRPR